ncbi:hypothetical protein HY634_04420 [Candidatus Uhrbacteria bacterium]|nr:hypothetical protein [Candidatus Uhrbacteria bacterium]
MKQFRLSAVKRYGGATRWAPALQGLAGEWMQGARTIPDEITPVWVMIGAGIADEALEDLAAWKAAFEEGLGEQVILVSHHVVETIVRLQPRRVRTRQRRLFGVRRTRKGALEEEKVIAWSSRNRRSTPARAFAGRHATG